MSIRIPLYFLIVIITAVVAIFIVSSLNPDFDMIQTPTARLLGNVIAIGAMIQSAIFSFLLIKQAEVNRKNSDEITEKNEAFRTFDFVAKNHTIVEFYERMTIARTNVRYKDRLREKMDFKFYIRHNGILMHDVRENFDNYTFLTIKMPLKIVVGNAIGMIRFINFVLEKDGEVHSFVPCSDDFQGLVLWNEEKQRQEITVNLILPKGSGFYNEKTVTNFTRIKVFLSMHSILGVVVKGWTELYFTNPQKRERDGANKYMIQSSQFKIQGLPQLEGVN